MIEQNKYAVIDRHGNQRLVTGLLSVALNHAKHVNGTVQHISELCSQPGEES